MKRVAKNYNSILIEALGGKVIAFNPILAQVAGSASAGLFFSQILFWWGKGARRGWIYKTIKEVYEETYLTRGEQDRAIRKWKQLGVLEVQLIGLPRKRHFHVNEDNLLKLLERTAGRTLLLPKASQLAKSSKLNGGFRHATTESTSKKTSKDSSFQEADVANEFEAGRRSLSEKLTLDDSYHD